MESTKQEIYRLHQEKPDKNTPEMLADRFQLSSENVNAILTLKKLEMEKRQSGAPLNVELAEFMDKILTENEKIYVEYEEPKKPFHAIYRDPKINATIERNKKLAEQNAKEKQEILKNQEDLGKVISREPLLANPRHGFLIFDKSSKKIFVREKDGTFRTGTWEEREKMLKKYAPTEQI